LAPWRERERLREGGVRSSQVVRHQVVAPEVVPCRGVLLLPGARQGLRENTVRVLQVLGALLRELGARRALQVQQSAVHQVMARLEFARGGEPDLLGLATTRRGDRKSTRLNSSHEWISYAVFCLKKKNNTR